MFCKLIFSKLVLVIEFGTVKRFDGQLMFNCYGSELIFPAQDFS